MFKHILQEALAEKQFESNDDLLKMVKSILRKSSLYSYREKKSSDGFVEPSRHGYKFTYLNGNITLSFMGVSSSEINELASLFAKNKINYLYNSHQEMFLIKAKDNVKLPEDEYPENVKEELATGIYDVLNSQSKDKSGIKNIINNFDKKQKEIYNFLINNSLAEWKYININNKATYKLMKTGDK